jgi:hypothetical protein
MTRAVQVARLKKMAASKTSPVTGKSRGGGKFVARRIAAVLDQPRKAGLLGEKDGRIAGSVFSRLRGSVCRKLDLGF